MTSKSNLLVRGVRSASLMRPSHNTILTLADMDNDSDRNYLFVFDGKPITQIADYHLSNTNSNNSNPYPAQGQARLEDEMRRRSKSDPTRFRTTLRQDSASASPPSGGPAPLDSNASMSASPSGPRYHYHRQRTGIYGWRKRCLYLTIAALTSLLILNLGLTIWMIRLLRFTWRGMGNLRIMPDGVIMNGRTVFNKDLRISEIRPSENGNLRLISDRSIIMKAQDANGNVANQIYIGPNGFVSQGPRFHVKNKDGSTLFEVTPDNMTVNMGTLHINNKNGARFKESVITPFIRSPPGQSLKLESLTRSLEVEANGVDMKALAGEINALSLQDITLSSSGGKIKLEGDIYMPDIVSVTPGTLSAAPSARNFDFQGDASTYKGVFQLCLCENGRLFLAMPESNCRGVYDICSAPL